MAQHSIQYSRETSHDGQEGDRGDRVLRRKRNCSPRGGGLAYAELHLVYQYNVHLRICKLVVILPEPWFAESNQIRSSAFVCRQIFLYADLGTFGPLTKSPKASLTCRF